MRRKMFTILFLITCIFTFTIIDIQANPNVEVKAIEEKREISNCYIEDIENKNYTGKAIKPNPVIIDEYQVLVLNRDYKLSYKNNKKLGTATVTIKGIGNYTGTIKKRFKIVVGKPKDIRVSNYDSSSITIKWNKPSGSISGYAVYYTDDLDEGFKKVFTTKTSFKASKLKVGKTYYFKVRAFKTINGKKKYSKFTNTIEASTKLSTPKVTLDRYLNSIDISYNKVSGASGYEIYYSINDNNYFKVIDTTKTYYTLNNLIYNKTYYVKVRAYKIVDENIIYSNYSKVVSKSLLLETPVINLTSGIDNVNITWNYIDEADAYEVYRSTSKYGTYKKIGATIYNYFEDEDLESNETYYYKVRAYNKNVYSNYSTIKSITTKIKLTKPVIYLTSGYDYVDISWNYIDGADGYQVYRSTSKYGTYKKIATTSNTYYTDTDLTSNKTYYYKVRAYTNINGNKKYSSFSSIKSIKTKKITENLKANLSFSGIFNKNINLDSNVTERYIDSLTTTITGYNNYLYLDIDVKSDGNYKAFVQVIDPYENVTNLLSYDIYSKGSYYFKYKFKYLGDYRLYVKLYDDGIYKEYTLYINVIDGQLNPVYPIYYYK